MNRKKNHLNTPVIELQLDDNRKEWKRPNTEIDFKWAKKSEASAEGSNYDENKNINSILIRVFDGQNICVIVPFSCRIVLIQLSIEIGISFSEPMKEVIPMEEKVDIDSLGFSTNHFNMFDVLTYRNSEVGAWLEVDEQDSEKN